MIFPIVRRSPEKAFHLCSGIESSISHAAARSLANFASTLSALSAPACALRRSRYIYGFRATIASETKASPAQTTVGERENRSWVASGSCEPGYDRLD